MKRTYQQKNKTSWSQRFYIIQGFIALILLTSCSGKVGLKLGGLTQEPSTASGITNSSASDVFKSSTNLLTNPGFESWMYGWTNYGSSVISRQNPFDGLNSLRVGSGAGGVGQDVTASFVPNAT